MRARDDAALSRFGPWLYAAALGLTVVSNDLVWLPAFALFLRALARATGGWCRLLAG